MKPMKIRRPGSRVFYPVLGKAGTVHRCINESDAEDLKKQGPRYEVYFDGWIWSVPERSLKSR